MSFSFIKQLTNYFVTFLLLASIYPRELQLNKANTSETETSLFDLNIKVISSNIHTSVYDKRDDFGFPIFNLPG